MVTERGATSPFATALVPRIMAQSAGERPRGTVAVYDRPPWWRRRRVWSIALPVIVAIASLVIWYLILSR